MTFTPLKEIAQGRWRSILPALGLPAARLNGRHGPCPMCDGVDRFRFDDKDGRGTWFCNQCGAGDGIALVMQMHGLDFRGAVERIEPLVGAAPIIASPKEQPDEEKRRWMAELWSKAKPIRADDPAGLFLKKRTGLNIYPHCLRYHDSVAYETDDGSRAHGPAMLAKLAGVEGNQAVNLHRTFLTFSGEKAPMKNPRRMMPGDIPPGSAIRLAPIAEHLGIAEGIETALSASAIHGVPCWSAINTTILAAWSPPAGVKRVTVFGDNDANYAGQHAAYKLANRLSVKLKIETAVCIPAVAGLDWNSMHMFSDDAQGQEHAAA